MVEDTTGEFTRELAGRVNDGADIRLLWSERKNRLVVRVADPKSGIFFELEAAGDRALDVFYHPYAYAAMKAV